MRAKTLVWALWIALLVPTSAGAPPAPAGHCGKVFDARTSLPLPQVDILAVHHTGQRVGTTTDSTGSYRCWFGRRSQVKFVATGYDTRVLEWPSKLKPTGQVDDCDCPHVASVALHPAGRRR